MPDAKPGRRVADPYARLGKHSPLKCGRCPKWQRRTSVCPLRGCHQAPDAQACRYGADLMKKGDRAT